MAKKTFEQSINELEEIINTLESGDLSLEEAFKKFEKGVALSKLCSQKLDETEKKITILLQNSKNEYIEKPFLTDNE
jgi:exodeoxyribonuclease VII small subunit